MHVHFFVTCAIAAGSPFRDMGMFVVLVEPKTITPKTHFWAVLRVFKVAVSRAMAATHPSGVH